MSLSRTSAVPSRMMNIASPASSLRASSTRAGKSTICACRAIVRRCRGVHREHKGTCSSTSASSRFGANQGPPPHMHTGSCRRTIPKLFHGRPWKESGFRAATRYLRCASCGLISGAIVAVVLFAAFDGSVHEKLTSGGFDDPGSRVESRCGCSCVRVAEVLVKSFGVGLTIAVLVDAFLIRATLVPAFMRLAGRLNWWSPRWLREWHLRFGIWENEPVALLDRQFEASVR